MRGYWNERIKGWFWGEIEDEVIEKMEDEEWQEENGVTFDRLDQEKSYFMSYWHYPMDSLGWDRDQLCDYYKDILESRDRDILYKVLKNYKTPKKQQIFIPDTYLITPFAYNKKLLLVQIALIFQ